MLRLLQLYTFEDHTGLALTGPNHYMASELMDSR